MKLKTGLNTLSAVVCLGLFWGSPTVAANDSVTDSKLLNTQRIISVGGSTTEILYALNEDKKIVGTDTSSRWPKEAQLLPQVGYMRNLSAEGVLSLSPTLLLADEEAGPNAVIEQIKNAGVPTMVLKGPKTPAGIIKKIRRIAGIVQATSAGEDLIEKLTSDFNRLEAHKSQQSTQPRVTFLFSVTPGSVLAAGRDTAADAMIRLAGGINVFTDYTSFKPITGEALIEAAPDILLLTDLSVQNLNGVEGIWRLPGVAYTPAGKNRRLIVMDTLYLLGFGPRTGQAALELHERLHSPSRLSISYD